MKKRELRIGKWHFKFGVIHIFPAKYGYLFHLGIFKLLKYPPEGENITKTQYKGFWFRKTINWQGFEIDF